MLGCNRRPLQELTAVAVVRIKMPVCGFLKKKEKLTVLRNLESLQLGFLGNVAPS